MRKAKAKVDIRTAIKAGAYAADVMPERLDAEERAGLAVPRATGSGRSAVQSGRIPPSQRVYKAHYKAVTAEEAQANMIARSRGEMDLIPGGLDTGGIAIGNEDKDEKDMSENFDPLGGRDEDAEPGSPELVAEETRLAVRTVAKSVASNRNPVVVDNTKSQQFLQRRSRISLELAEGMMALTAIDLRHTQYGLTIILPLVDEGVTFIPKPGSEITVAQSDGKRFECFFPGTYFELPELGILGLVFVKKQEGA